MFIVGTIILIKMASFIQSAHLLVSLSTTFAPSQCITQLYLSAWSVIANLCSPFVDHCLVSRVKCLIVMVWTSFLCSSSLVPNVMLCYVTHIVVLHGIRYTQPVLRLSSTLSFGCTSFCPRFLSGVTADAISWCFRIRCTGSISPWTLW